jgi:hypothetical protein
VGGIERPRRSAPLRETLRVAPRLKQGEVLEHLDHLVRPEIQKKLDRVTLAAGDDFEGLGHGGRPLVRRVAPCAADRRDTARVSAECKNFL